MKKSAGGGALTPTRGAAAGTIDVRCGPSAPSSALPGSTRARHWPHYPGLAARVIDLRRVQTPPIALNKNGYGARMRDEESTRNMVSAITARVISVMGSVLGF